MIPYKPVNATFLTVFIFTYNSYIVPCSHCGTDCIALCNCKSTREQQPQLTRSLDGGGLMFFGWFSGAVIG